MTPSERIHRIQVPTPFYVGPVNVYLLEGEPLTLFDCGPNTPEAYQALVDGLAARGYTLSDIEQVIVSHHHTDHIGLINRVIEESSAQIAVHEYTLPYLQQPYQTRERDLEFFLMVGREGNVPSKMLTAMRDMTRWIGQFGNQPIEATRVLREGDTITAGGTTWQVYHTPGHAGDLICLFDPQSGVMMADDHIILKISSNPLIEPAPVSGEPRPRRLVEYIRHLKRMAALNPVIAYSGHGEPVENVTPLVNERVAMHHQRADKIFTYFEAGPQHLWAVTEKLFAHVGDDQKFLAMSEVLGHIDMLECQERLERDKQDGIIYWSTPSA